MSECGGFVAEATDFGGLIVLQIVVDGFAV